MSTEIGARIKQWRHALGLTQAELAQRLGVHIGVLKKYEQGLNVPGGDALAAIAKTGVNMTWLLTGEGEMLPQPARGALQVIEGEGKQSPPRDGTARLVRQIQGILDALPEDEALRKAQELFARAQEMKEQHELRQALAELSARLDATGT
ncbi:MAG: helix-turn-helix transcriptional regulator [Rhodocyclaceae bacterium]